MMEVVCRYPPTMATKSYGKKYRQALEHTAKLHDRQFRKGTKVPYLSHLLHVSALVWEHGGTETQAIAALLHDSVEDQGGRPLLREIGKRYGKDVARIVEECSDSILDSKKDREVQKAPWLDRKLAHLDHLAAAHDDTMLVALADKTHNTEAMLADAETHGGELWDRFNAGPEESIWYQHRMSVIVTDRLGADHPLVRRHSRALDALARQAGVHRDGARPPQA